MPNPTAGESKNDFMKRCIPMVKADGTADSNDQAVAVCLGKWGEHSITPDEIEFYLSLVEGQDKMESMYLLDDYVSVTAGEPFRLFPFGRIIKGGETHDITPELARKFRLPHFRPPIKRGSHADDAPAGGHIRALEVRDDGLWAIPEYNEKGLQAVRDGDFRYNSPEVIWSDGPVFEDPATGEMIHGPLIVGDALLHMPHLGESAALYSVEPIMEGENMTEPMEVVQVPKTFWDSIKDLFATKPDPEPEQTPAVNVEQFDALKVERDNLKAEVDRMKAEGDKQARVDKYAAVIAETKANKELAEMLAGFDDETADRIVQEFKALSAQIDESALLGEKGTTGDGLPEDPTEALDKAVKAKMAEKDVDYNAALAILEKEAPELVANYGG